MQSFIHRKNLENYRRLLEQTTDEEERQVLSKLIEEEETKNAPLKASKRGKPEP